MNRGFILHCHFGYDNTLMLGVIFIVHTHITVQLYSGLVDADGVFQGDPVSPIAYHVKCRLSVFLIMTVWRVCHLASCFSTSTVS